MQIVMPRALPRQITGPVVAVLARIGVTPNMLTVAQLAGGLVAAYVIAQGELAIGAVILIASATLDAFDGTLARSTGRATPFGGVFDSVVDRLFEGAVLGGVLWYYLEAGQDAESMAVFVTLLGSMSVSYVRARAEGAGIEIYDGIFTRVVRLLFLTAGLLLADLVAREALDAVIWFLAVATLLTTLHRLYAVWTKMESPARMDRREGVLAEVAMSEMDEPDYGDEEMDFLSANWHNLWEKYKGKWIAVEGNKVVAVGDSETEADESARKLGVSVPFVVEVSLEDELPFIGAV
jgi:CDP-diacylglycerol--glycerol-3-phosphate 3-phosphatidyltransferase